MRQLASIQAIKSVEPHPNADALEIAQVLGWKVCVRKGEFNSGDLCIYMEVDSVLPERQEFEFLRERRFRIKAIRLRGFISQGICFKPEELLPPGMSVCEDQDVTETLGVTLYEPPESGNRSQGECAGDFPTHIVPKTDETRVQVLERLIDKYAGQEFTGTVKLDGSSTTIAFVNGEFFLASRNRRIRTVEQIREKHAAENPDQDASALQIEASHFEKALNDVGAIEKLSRFCMSNGFSLALQGETVGPGIQGNKYGLKQHTIRFYNGWLPERQRYLSNTELADVLADIGLPMVDIVWEGNLPSTVDELMAIATSAKPYDRLYTDKGFTQILPLKMDEGIVFRPEHECVEVREDGIDLGRNLHNGRVSFKAINPEFSVQYGGD